MAHAEVPGLGAWQLNRECATAPARDSARGGVGGSEPGQVIEREFGFTCARRAALCSRGASPCGSHARAVCARSCAHARKAEAERSRPWAPAPAHSRARAAQPCLSARIQSRRQRPARLSRRRATWARRSAPSAPSRRTRTSRTCRPRPTTPALAWSTLSSRAEARASCSRRPARSRAPRRPARPRARRPPDGRGCPRLTRAPCRPSLRIAAPRSPRPAGQHRWQAVPTRSPQRAAAQAARRAAARARQATWVAASTAAGARAACTRSSPPGRAGCATRARAAHGRHRSCP